MNPIELRLRQLVWSLHSSGGDAHYRYGDDGELQCSSLDGYCDFLRDNIEQIEQHINNRGLRLFHESQHGKTNSK